MLFERVAAMLPARVARGKRFLDRFG